MEILIAIIILLLSIYIIYRNIKKSSKGQCDCGTCSSHCSKYISK